MMEKKFIQREETHYENNEFSNMPSIDYGTLKSERLNAKRKSRVDFEKAEKICAKYGFKCTYIDSTFGGDDAEFVIYLKTDIPADYYAELVKNLGKNDKENDKKFLDAYERYKPTFLKLHDCIHELDEQTYLMFECGWVGNCGMFGSNDVYKQSYCGASSIKSWASITNCWSPSIYNTLSRLSKGVYVMASTNYLKPVCEDSPALVDMEQTLLDLTRSLISGKYVANFECGKRQCDGKEEPYKALVIRYKDNNEYCSMMRFSRDWMGRYKILSASPLCGQSSWVMDWKNPKDDILSAIGKCRK